MELQTVGYDWVTEYAYSWELLGTVLPRLRDVKGLTQGHPARKWWSWVSDFGLSDFRVTVLSALELWEPQGLCPGGQGRLHGRGGHSWSSKVSSKGAQRCRQREQHKRRLEPRVVGLGPVSSSVLEHRGPAGVAGRCDWKVEQHQRALRNEPRRGAGLQAKHRS